jgi:two-component system, sensor histidine kinase and response regulator
MSLRVLTIAGTVVALTLAGWFLYEQYRHAAKLVAHQNTIALEVAYRSTINMYRLDAETRVQAQILRPEVVDILRRVPSASETEKAVLRGQLYRLMRPVYQDLVNRGARQLYFHTPDGTVFLRVHSPERAGDRQMDIRPSIRIANTELRPAAGFEGGRIAPAFRNVFPLVYEGQHLGSVDLSLSFDQIHSGVMELIPEGNCALLLRPEISRDLVFEERRSLFIQAALHPDFVQEHPTASQLTRAFEESATARALSGVLRGRHDIQERVRSGESFSVPLLHDGQAHIATYYAIRDVTNRLAAYVVAVSPAPLLADLYQQFLRKLIAAAALILFAAAALWWLLRNRHALAAERSRLEAITQSMGEGLYVIDRNARIEYANPAAGRMLGYTPEALRGRDIHDLIRGDDDPDGAAPGRCPISETLEARRSYVGEEHCTDNCGRVFPAQVHSEPLIEGGQVTGAVVVFQDITERKHTEQALREADRRKDEFLAMLGHELRNPLVPIRNAAHVLGLIDVDEPRVRWAHELIERQVTHLSRLVDDLLEVSRVVRGKVVLKREPLSLSALIEQATETARPSLEAKGHRLEVSLPDALVPLEWDPVRLTQVLVNLLDNAAKYTPERGCIELHARALDGEVEIAVRDHGQGIPPELLPWVFELFRQGERTLDRSEGGLGVGLTLVKKLVELHGGRVEALSAGPGQGATFVVRLPMALGSRAALPDPTGAPARAEAARALEAE